MKIAFEKTDTNLKVLKTSFKTLKHYNKLIQKSINYFGLEKTMLIYKKSKWIFRFIKQMLSNLIYRNSKLVIYCNSLSFCMTIF